MTRLTKEELESIRKRAEAATPGPWFWLDDGRLYSDGADKVIGEVIEGKDETWFDLFDTNAEFIAHAREDVPKLLEYIDELKAELSRLCPIADLDTITTLKTEIAYCDECIAELKVEIERYEKALKEIKDGLLESPYFDSFKVVKQALEGSE